jgi:hypothetical protein
MIAGAKGHDRVGDWSRTEDQVSRLIGRVFFLGMLIWHHLLVSLKAFRGVPLGQERRVGDE